MHDRVVAAINEVRKRFPNLDRDVDVYLEAIITENWEHFESADEIYEAIGSFLEDAGCSSDVRTCCAIVYNTLHPNGRIVVQDRLDAPVHMASLVNTFNDRAIDSTSIWVAKHGTHGTVSANFPKAEMRSREKHCRRQQNNEIFSKNTISEVYSVSVIQRSDRRDKVSSDGIAKKVIDCQIEDFDVSFGSRVLLQNANLRLSFGRRYGLIGRNGCGKTTLLRALASGDLTLPPGMTVLHVEQEELGDDTSAVNSVLQADKRRVSLLAELAELRARQESDETSSQMAKIYDQLLSIDADGAPSRAASILHGLGFGPRVQDLPTKEFSGGWRMRLALAQALFAKPDLLLLDEPTNMLDMRAIIWLEGYVQNWSGIMIVVSHDQSFLNSITTDIIHLTGKRLNFYRGDYDAFVKAREERVLNEEREYLAQKVERDHIQKFIDTFRYNAKRASLVQSRIKTLERMPKLIPPEKPSKVVFKLPQCEKLTQQPLVRLEGVHFYYKLETPLFEDVDFSVFSTSRICIVGENGAGKTTLLRLLLGELTPTKGLRHCHRSLRVSYFSQHHTEQLDLNVSSLEFLMRKFPGETEHRYRSQLASFEVDALLAQQPIRSLSGGQKSRVAFAVLFMSRPNLLILDEPTNHLDIETIDAMIESLKKFNGGVVLVSHDERLISSLCTEYWTCTRFPPDAKNWPLKISRLAVLAGGLEEYRRSVQEQLDVNVINR